MKGIDHRILIIDDEKFMCELLCHLMEKEGFKPMVANDGESGLKMMRLQEPDVILLDVRMMGMDGMEVLKRVKELDPDLPVIIITGYAEVRGAVEAIRVGAYDYISKPFEHLDVIRVVRRAMEERELKCKIKNFTSHVERRNLLGEIMGPSEAVKELISLINRVANSNYAVVIQGETGVGKELVARSIHSSSQRSDGPFVAIDCGAIPEALLESELFGHEKGAYTGAGSQKPGKFELAEKGTLFLDEISNMPLNSQAKLLRVIQEKRVYRVGASKPVKIDVRLLVASNRDLRVLAESGSFRRDLFYRLNEFTITIPPLRERKEDIIYLAKRFLDITNAELKMNVKGFSKSALEVMLLYDWPGNVRQLRSVVRRAVLLTDDWICEKHLDIKRVPVPSVECSPKVQETWSRNRTLKEIRRQNIIALEREVLVQALKYTGGNKAKAARILQIDYKTIHTKIKQLKILTCGGCNEQEG